LEWAKILAVAKAVLLWPAIIIIQVVIKGAGLIKALFRRLQISFEATAERGSPLKVLGEFLRHFARRMLSLPGKPNQRV
jgi:hypothetical protein